MEARLIKDNLKALDYTAAAAITSGEILALDDGRVGVAVNDMVSGDLGAVMPDGVFDVASASATTFSAGGNVFWDKSASAAVPYADADDIYIGKALVAKVATELLVRVDLNVITYDQIVELIAAT
jgi:predicted RecA/RadA family phage recombinase